MYSYSIYFNFMFSSFSLDKMQANARSLAHSILVENVHCVIGATMFCVTCLFIENVFLLLRVMDRFGQIQLSAFPMNTTFVLIMYPSFDVQFYSDFVNSFGYRRQSAHLAIG